MARNIKVALDFLGCKVNQAETESMTRLFRVAGYSVVSPRADADIYILNTCTVTEGADAKSRHWFRMMRHRHPSAAIVATGCYTGNSAADLTSLGVNLVIPNANKLDIVKLIGEAGLIGLFEADRETNRFRVSRTRTFLKIQDGCRNFCTYCIVPLARGEEASVPADDVIQDINKRERERYQEVVITGVKVGTYNHKGLDLTGLLERILRESRIPRIRLSSLQPSEITPELIGLWADSRLCRHFHLSLQSGSDSVLKQMHRRYDIAVYSGAVSLIRSVVPDASITTDVIAGFPGETLEEFNESYEFCRKTGFARIHVFPFSRRSGTLAAEMPGQVNDREKKRRTRLLLSLAAEAQQSFYRKYLGKKMPVLFEQKSGAFWTGLTDNYIRVAAAIETDITNQILSVELKELAGNEVRGDIVDPGSPSK